MAHFAKIENQIVTQILVVDNENCGNKEFPESEALGYAYLNAVGLPGTYVQTSYNGKFRKHYAAVGYTYDSINDYFVPPKPFNSWLFDQDTATWYAPVEYPNNGKSYEWNEETQEWTKYRAPTEISSVDAPYEVFPPAELPDLPTL